MFSLASSGIAQDTLCRFLRRPGQEGRGHPERTPEAWNVNVAHVEVVPGHAGHDPGRESQQHEHGRDRPNPGEHHGRAVLRFLSRPGLTEQPRNGRAVGAEPVGASPTHQLPEAVRAHRAHACGHSGEASRIATQPGRAGTTEDGLRRAGQGTEQRQGARRLQETLSCNQAAVAAPGKARHLAGYWDAGLLNRPLVNPNNVCYTNSTIVSLLWTASRVPLGLRACMPKALKDLSLALCADTERLSLTRVQDA